MLKKTFYKVLLKLCRTVIGKHQALIRWYYSENLMNSVNVAGSGIKINGKIDVIYPKGFILGNNVHIGKGAFIDARAGVVIGDHTHISRNVTIYSTNHNYEGEVIPYDQTLVPGRVIIEEGVWIGMNVCITPGVTIGRGAIIGMGSVISKDVKEGEIVVSNTQRVVGSRDLDLFDRKINSQSIGGISGRELDREQKANFKKTLLPAKNGGDNIVFVLSTGRSGSNALARIMEQDQSVISYHEPLYVLLKTISAKYLCGRIDKEAVKRQLIKYYSTIPLTCDNKIYLESDQKLIPFLDVLLELFPNAKFIWLIRDPYKFALSATSRGWFNRDDKIFFMREEPVVDRRLSSEGQRNFFDYSDKLRSEYQIDSLTPFEKNVLYWKIWNKMIYDEYLNMNKENKLFVKLESLGDQMADIQRFVGISGHEKIHNKKTNRVKESDKAEYEQNKKKLNELITSCRINLTKEIELWYNINR